MSSFDQDDVDSFIQLARAASQVSSKGNLEARAPADTMSNRRHNIRSDEPSSASRPRAPRARSPPPVEPPIPEITRDLENDDDDLNNRY